MNSIDESKVTEETVQEETEENEQIDSSIDLEQKKRNANEFNAEGNMAQIQIFIQNLRDFNMDYKQSKGDVDPNLPLKKYDLRSIEECSEFVEKYGDSEYLAIAIILSTFEVVALGDLSDLKQKLMEYLPETQVMNDEGKMEKRSRRDPYISLNTIFTVVGGKRFVTEDGQTCIGLGENSKQALFNILEQFPVLRSSIVSWLIQINEVYKYRTTFDAYQIMTAFVRVISLDIIDAKRRIFPQLYSNSGNAGLLGSLVCKLYEDVALREEVDAIILQWLQSDGTWLWKPACLSYSFFMSNNNCSFERDLKKAIKKRIFRLKRTDLRFIAALLIQSKYFRTMLADILHSVYERSNTREKKLELSQIYINIIRYSYYQVDAFSVELPLVACDTMQQQKYLAQIIAQIMSVYSLRKQLYAIVEAYLKELSGYDFSTNVINHIAAYFYNLGSSDIAYQQDIISLLRNSKNKAGRQIYDRLYQAYEKEGVIPV